MATSSRVYKSKLAPEDHFDKNLLDSIGMVEIWGYYVKLQTMSRISSGVYFGPDSRCNLGEMFLRGKREFGKHHYKKLAEVYAAIIALQITLTSIIAKTELTKDIKIILLKVQSGFLITTMARRYLSREGEIWRWMETGMKTRRGKPIPLGEYLKVLQELWLAVEERGVELQMFSPEKAGKNNKALELAAEADRTGRTSCFNFPLSVSDVLRIFNIPCTRSSSKERMIEEEGADDEGTSDEEIDETDQNDRSEEGTDEEVVDEE
jgi:hypothetical protein